MTLVRVTIPGLRVSSKDNSRGSWQAKARVTKRERWLTRLALGARRAWTPPVRVVLTRVAPCPLDTGGLWSALKAVQDEVAVWLGVDDGRSERDGSVLWEVRQERGGVREYAVRIEFTEPIAGIGSVGWAKREPIPCAVVGAVCDFPTIARRLAAGMLSLPPAAFAAVSIVRHGCPDRLLRTLPLDVADFVRGRRAHPVHLIESDAEAECRVNLQKLDNSEAAIEARAIFDIVKAAREAAAKKAARESEDK